MADNQLSPGTKVLARLRRKPTSRNQAQDSWITQEGVEAAKSFCLGEIAFYDNVSKTNHTRWRRWQIITLLAGVIGTIASAISLPPTWMAWEQDFGWLRAIPVAIASFGGALLGSFSYQAESVRQGLAAAALRGELASLIAKADPYGKGDDADASLFMQNVRGIITAETGRWSDQNLKPAERA